MRYSKTTGGFYPDDILYTNPPADLIEVSTDGYNAAMNRSGGATLDVQNGELVIIRPTPAQLLAQAQTAQITLVRASCAAAITNGFLSSALGAPHTYPSGTTDQANLSANVMSSMYPNLPANWTTLQECCDSTGKGAYLPHTAAQIQQAGADGKAAILACLTKNAGLQAQIMAAEGVPSVQKIVW